MPTPTTSRRRARPCRTRQRFWLLLGRAHPTSRLPAVRSAARRARLAAADRDSDSADEAKAKLVDGLAPWFADNATAQAHAIGQLIGLDFSASPHVQGVEPRRLRALAFDALCSYRAASPPAHRPSRCCSKTCSGPTTARSTSSTTCCARAARCRCCWSAPHARS